ncbi:hypothetical protein FSP39_003935 [Pinctada imbricata]|uniref:Uncharacterized protein n=1 Tax=Pinctada imbricata TaxID=66713 RepID=A0AA88XG07_PINIB|nr:hypothetical protein FSP39_003935 [Pinctada imbricata]
MRDRSYLLAATVLLVNLAKGVNSSRCTNLCNIQEVRCITNCQFSSDDFTSQLQCEMNCSKEEMTCQGKCYTATTPLQVTIQTPGSDRTHHVDTPTKPRTNPKPVVTTTQGRIGVIVG